MSIFLYNWLMLRKIKLIIATIVLSTAFGFLPVGTAQADHGGVEQDDCQPGLILNPGHSACIEPTEENDPDDCASAGSPDAIERCLAASRAEGAGPAGPGFGEPEPGNLCGDQPDGSVNTCEVAGVTCDGADRENPESDNILCRLLQIVDFLSVGVAVVAAISVTVAGAQYVVSRGDPNKTAKAINRLIQVGMAIVIYVFGWALMNWLIPGGAI